MIQDISGTITSYMHIETILRQKQRDLCQNVPDISYLYWMCLGTWFPVPALCGGLDVPHPGDHDPVPPHLAIAVQAGPLSAEQAQPYMTTESMTVCFLGIQSSIVTIPQRFSIGPPT